MEMFLMAPYSNELVGLLQSTPPKDVYRRNVACQLALLIAAQRQFQTIADLCNFCADPENLRPWLPSRADRMNLSAELATSLQCARPS